RVGWRIDPEAGGREQGLELRVAAGLSEAFSVQTSEVRDADGAALELGAEAGGCAEEALGGVEDTHEHAGAVEIAGNTCHRIEYFGHRCGCRRRASGQRQRRAVSEKWQLDGVEASRFTADGESPNDTIADPEAFGDGAAFSVTLGAAGETAIGN